MIEQAAARLAADHRMRTAQELESMLAAARLRPLAWQRVYDLGRLPLVQAVTSEVAGPAAGR
jgi:hypothetical protein